MSVNEEQIAESIKGFAERFLEAAKKYIDDTVEVTRTVRVPKGEHCHSCVFQKQEYNPLLSASDSECCGCGYVWCSLYGDRLEIDRDKSLVTAMLPNGTLTFKKCTRCLADTNKTD